jgi:hypothetical protein
MSKVYNVAPLWGYNDNPKQYSPKLTAAVLGWRFLAVLIKCRRCGMEYIIRLKKQTWSLSRRGMVTQGRSASK